MKTLPAPLLPEWAPIEALFVGWPSDEAIWEAPFQGARAETAAFVNALAEAHGEAGPSIVLVADGVEAVRAAQAAAGALVDVLDLALGDTWLRDTGPLFGHENGAVLAHGCRFNGWGGKYVYPGDEDLSERLAGALGVPYRAHDFILEGGSIDSDGRGTILTTRECLLNANRNAGWSEDSAREALSGALGVRHIVWLGDGLRNDHTDGHVDNIARFIELGHVVCQAPSGADDPNADRLEAIENTLKAAVDADGNALRVTRIPSPGRVLDSEGEVVPASHMNFVITPALVVVPTYNQLGEAAVKHLADIFPDRRVIGLPSSNILTGGGSFHCISQHQYAPPSELEL